MAEKSNKKTILIMAFIVMSFILLVVLPLLLFSGRRDLDLNSYERSDLARIRVAEADSNLGGRAMLIKDSLDTIEKVIKKYDKKANWFSKNTGLFYINDIESQKKETLQISDGENCATIELKNEYTISGYSFKPEKCGKHVVMSLTKEEIDKIKQ